MIGELHVKAILSAGSVGMPFCIGNGLGSDIFGSRHGYGVFVDTQSDHGPNSGFQTQIHFTI